MMLAVVCLAAYYLAWFVFDILIRRARDSITTEEIFSARRPVDIAQLERDVAVPLEELIKRAEAKAVDEYREVAVDDVPLPHAQEVRA